MSFASEAAVKDIKGWDKAEWGMTEEDLLSVFGKRATYHKNTYSGKFRCNVSIEGIEIKNNVYRADLLLDSETHRLVRINFKLTKESSYFSDFKTEFDELSGFLTENYGQPSLKESYYPEVTQQWKFPSTTIDLRLVLKPSFLSFVYISTADELKAE